MTNVTSVAELRKLDVIVLNHVSNIPPEALDAIEAAVKEGTGLYVRQHMGTGEPGFTPQVKRLLLLADGQYGWNPKPVACEIVGEHPLLGTLSGKTGRVIDLYANGPYGVLAPGAIPLIRVKTMSDISPVGPDVQPGRDDFVHYPLYVGEYGKGRIVVCSLAAFGATPAVLRNAANRQFTARCVRWAARQPVEEAHGFPPFRLFKLNLVCRALRISRGAHFGRAWMGEGNEESISRDGRGRARGVASVGGSTAV